MAGPPGTDGGDLAGFLPGTGGGPEGEGRDIGDGRGGGPDDDDDDAGLPGNAGGAFRDEVEGGEDPAESEAASAAALSLSEFSLSIAAFLSFSACRGSA